MANQYIKVPILGGGGGGAVSSVFGRVGAVVAENGDYNTDQVTEGLNLYFTDQRARSAISGTAPLSYDSVTGILSIVQAASGVDGYLSGSDWDLFNGKVNKSGDSMSGYLTLVGDPVSSGQAATKSYVDMLADGLKWKTLVEAASTGNLVLSGEQTVDGVALVAGDRVLVKDQASAPENGIYDVSAGAWSRSSDANTGDELELAAVIVNAGTVNGGKAFIQTTPEPITIGVTNIVFVNFLSTTYTANGQALQLSGTQFSVVLDGTTLSQSASGLKVADGGITNTQVNAAAAVARTKLASGTANRILVNNGSGVMTDHTAQTATCAAYYDANGLPASSTATFTGVGGKDFTLTGVINLPATTSTAGIINIAGSRFISSFGTQNTFLGVAGNTTLSTAQRNVGIGQSSMTSISTGSNNVSSGYAALNALTTGSQNTAIGQVSLSLVTTGTGNTAIGALSAQNAPTTTGSVTYVGFSAGRAQQSSNQVAIGREALRGDTVTPANNTGSQSTAVGFFALASSTSGVSNTAVGYNVAPSLTSSAQVTVMGALAGGAITTGSSITALGYASGNQISTNSNMTAVGDAAQRYITVGNQTSVGRSALRGNSTPANNTGSANNAFGMQSLEVCAAGANNNAFGFQTGLVLTSGNDNCFFGNVSGTNITTGSENNFFGSGSGQFQLTASRNHAFGYRALRGNSTPANNTGNDNYAFGYLSLTSNTSGNQNVALGYFTLNANTSGTNNTAIGHNAMLSNTTQTGSVAVGAQSQRYWNFGDARTSVGFEALRGNTTSASNTGVANTAIGYQALRLSDSGSNNVALGYLALTTSTSASQNTALGTQSLFNLTVGASNTAIGYRSGQSLTSGSTNIFIGNDAGFNASQSASANSSIAIGAGSYTETSNQMVIGSTGSQITDFRLGTGSSSSTPYSITIQPTKVASGVVNTNGANFNITAGNSTGTGVGGVINFSTSGTGASGSTENLATVRWTVMTFGTLRGTNVHNNISDAAGSSTQQDIRSGTYTPTVSSTINISSSNVPLNSAMWSRVGNIVTVTGTIDLTYSSSATPSTVVLSLPFASSNFTTTYQASGNFIKESVAGLGPIVGIVYSNLGAQTVTLQTLSNASVGSQEHRFTFQYEVV